MHPFHVFAMSAHGGRGGGHAGGRHGGGHGAGGDGPDWRRGRKFSADDLQLMILALLEEGPSHGYELIKALGARSRGFYTPSPGMVYPTLTWLEEAGHATVSQDGARKHYHLAEPGRAHLQANRERVTLLMAQLAHVGRKMEWMRRAWAGQPIETGSEGEDLATGWLPEYVQARMALKQVLARHADATPARQRQLAAILARAAAELDDLSS
ncbi:PadR family transcriptional regulator [Bordetella bronchiseptica]